MNKQKLSRLARKFERHNEGIANPNRQCDCFSCRLYQQEQEKKEAAS